MSGGLLTLLFNPIGSPVRTGFIAELLTLMVMGAMMSQPMQCALWGALAPSPLRWRFLVASVAAGVLAVAASVNTGDQGGFFLKLVVFALFLGVYAVLRAVFGVRYGLSEGVASDSTNDNRFGVSYLLIWTTVVAAFAAFAPMMVGGRLAGTNGVVSFVWYLVGSTVVLGVLMIPVQGCALLPLSRSRRKLVGFLGVPFSALVATALAAKSIQWMDPRVPAGFFELWQDLFLILAGACLWTTLGALVLRRAGYQLAVGKAP